LKNNSNECVNVQKIHKREIHKYLIGNTHFTVSIINKNENPRLVLERLKSVVVNHTDIKV